jgi:hypothetical protein
VAVASRRRSRVCGSQLATGAIDPDRDRRVVDTEHRGHHLADDPPGLIAIDQKPKILVSGRSPS